MTCVIDFLNVGFGEATVIRTATEGRGYCVVVDAGDAGPAAHSRRCSLEAYIREQAIEKIDAMILTHFHKDHIGGALSIMGRVPIGQMMVHVPLPERLLNGGVNDHATPMLSSLSLYAAIWNRARELGIPLVRIEEPCTIGGQGVECKLLMPGKGKLLQLQAELDGLEPERLASQRERLDRIDRLLNDTALAVLIRSEGQPAALLTSDVGLDFWEPYEAEIGPVPVVQAPHHGDANRMSGDWLRRRSPRYIVVSADDEGTYGLPHRERIEQTVREHTEAELIYTEGPGTAHRLVRLDVTEWKLILLK